MESIDRAVLGELRNPLITSSNDPQICMGLQHIPEAGAWFPYLTPPPPAHPLSSGATCSSTTCNCARSFLTTLPSPPPEPSPQSSASAPPCCMHSTPLPTHPLPELVPFQTPGIQTLGSSRPRLTQDQMTGLDSIVLVLTILLPVERDGSEC